MAKKPNYSMEDLYKKSVDVVLRLLISCAKQKKKIYYSQVADILSNQVVPGHVSDQVIGGVVGNVANIIWERFPTAPPINMIVVSKKNEIASGGSLSHLMYYFKLDRKPGARQRQKYSDIAVSDVWSFDDWDTIYRSIARRKWRTLETNAVTEFDDDGQGDNPRFGGLPESDEHKRLKDYIFHNPEFLKLNDELEAKREFIILSGDKIDVALFSKSEFFAIEVKSRRSGEHDLIRGVYQCIKYKAVLRAQYKTLISPENIDAYLVTENEITNKIRILAKSLSVKTFTVKPK